ncbi:hypothetical protein NDR87_20770 [Nocardia sp. CDC159]|uniref:Ribosomal RNA methyltransferase FtsJ domain-containing protein n=1 Tax=Nocardia pulmonis TaxID=2951408 RepID=A0A9X2IZS3_9NOCA|nr:MULTISPECIES: SAM-dependent methyltransferase [Nocardia]MCM6776380.1 hypothetical protein [Nocardia pulmonis]MCM6788804.1 hypothetical protein [Nocardia sp. CDC159]
MADDPSRVLFSASPDYFRAAEQDLLELFGADRRPEIRRLAPDLGRVSAPGLRLDELAHACRTRPLPFIRHLTTERAELPVAIAADLDAVGAHIRRVATELGVGELAVQVWTTGSNPLPYGTADLARHSMKVLAELGISSGRANMSHTLSLCVVADGLLIGAAATVDQLSDWPGGRIRLARHADQISRAEFKLEEAFQILDITAPENGTALDLGASPGGWTKVLRRYGLEVWAVDPADLDPRLARDRGVRHLRMTAGEFFRQHRREFDVVVDDMKMAPELSCKIMNDAARALRPGGLAIVTLKLSPNKPTRTVRHCLDLLDGKYRLIAARQLQHNRHEVTVVAQRRRRSN